MSLNPKSARRDDFPNFGQQVDRAGKLDAVDPTVARLIVQSGLNDGNRGDDVVNVSKGSWPAAALKPSQTSMVLGKAIGMALKMLKEGKVGGDLGAIVSKDKHILDGHHRWAATILASGTKGKVGGYGANLKGKDLLKVLNIMSKGLFGIRNGKPGKGDLSQFTESNVRGMMSDFVENGIGGDHPWSPESVQSVLVDNFGSVEAGIDAFAGNAGLITNTVPGWAPDRKQMPVIDEGNLAETSKVLNRGEVDWNDPHRKEGSRTLTAYDRKRLTRMASALPKGSEERRAILAGLKAARRPKIVFHPKVVRGKPGHYHAVGVGPDGREAFRSATKGMTPEDVAERALERRDYADHRYTVTIYRSADAPELWWDGPPSRGKIGVGSYDEPVPSMTKRDYKALADDLESAIENTLDEFRKKIERRGGEFYGVGPGGVVQKAVEILLTGAHDAND